MSKTRRATRKQHGGIPFGKKKEKKENKTNTKKNLNKELQKAENDTKALLKEQEKISDILGQVWGSSSNVTNEEVEREFAELNINPGNEVNLNVNVNESSIPTEVDNDKFMKELEELEELEKEIKALTKNNKKTRKQRR